MLYGYVAGANLGARHRFVKSEAPLGDKPAIYNGLRSQIAEWLTESMRKGRWGPTALGRESGISRQAITAILRRRSQPSGDTIAKLAKAMGVDPPGLLPGRVQESIVSPPLAALPALTPEEVATIAQLVASAVHKTVETNELHTGRDGFRLLWRALAAFRDQLVADGLDEQYVAELDAAISELKRIKQRRLDPPNGPQVVPGGSGT